MSQKDWDKRWLLYYNAYWLETRDHERSFDAAHKAMLKYVGPRPEGPSGPGLITGIVQTGLILRKVSNMQKPSVLAVAAAIGAAAAAFGASYSLASVDGVVTAMEWVSIAIAVIPAFLSGLFQSPSKNV
jgi:hypothetical protein